MLEEIGVDIVRFFDFVDSCLSDLVNLFDNNNNDNKTISRQNSVENFERDKLAHRFRDYCEKGRENRR